jgi:hypothetical protein
MVVQKTPKPSKTKTVPSKTKKETKKGNKTDSKNPKTKKPKENKQAKTDKPEVAEEESKKADVAEEESEKPEVFEEESEKPEVFEEESKKTEVAEEESKKADVAEEESKKADVANVAEEESEKPEEESEKPQEAKTDELTKTIDITLNANYSYKKVDKWYLPNRVGYYDWISNNFKYSETSSDINAKVPQTLFTQQQFVRDFLQPESPYRGLLLYHGLGSGKTGSAVIFSQLAALGPNPVKVVVFLPKYLKTNFVSEIKKFGSKEYTAKNFKWKQGKGKFWVRGTSNTDDTSFKSYNDLNAEQKKQIDNTINAEILEVYRFVHYDGFSKSSIDEFSVEYFKDKVVIIDEVHNFIQSVVNEGLARVIYNYLLYSKNCKILCLSGTPMINRPIELAFLINLVKGAQYIYNIQVPSRLFQKNNELIKAVKKIFQETKKVDHYVIDYSSQCIKWTVVPDNFSLLENEPMMIYSEQEKVNAVTNNLRDAFISLFESLNPKAKTDAEKSKVNLDFALPLPVDEDVFNNLFIDYKLGKILHEELFIQRILGAISYYESIDLDVYPRVNETIIEYTPMSNHQFQIYQDFRAVEMKQEQRIQEQRKKDISRGENVPSYYRTYSRSISNFAFPKGILRPLKKNIKDKILWNEVDDDTILDTNTETTVTDKVDNIYKETLQKILVSLEAKQKEYLNTELETHSPKYKRIIDNLQKTNGTALVYSQFKNLEGIFIFSMALRCNGYAELGLVKDKNKWRITIEGERVSKDPSDYQHLYIKFNEEIEKTRILLKIFNSELEDINNYITNPEILNSKINLHGEIVKVLLITKSGSEGISLKNVRQVHIMEPYWNHIRNEQIIGRAVRAHSHSKLPPDERNVDIYYYISTLPYQSDKNAKRSFEETESSDEYIFKVALRKKEISDHFTNILKKSSVDCYMSGYDNCYKVTVNGNGAFYNPNLLLSAQEDAKENAYTKTQITERQPQNSGNQLSVIEFKKEKYIFDKTNNKLYDYTEYTNTKTLLLVGELMQNGDTYEILFL